ncbi:zinc finger C2HC domain-containing protein 1C isoform X2 [Manduca sexta]|uniref:zinc finger C2HC domain-containing protein 1C isoform X2 n=1 Tax=Manduca sexta TaxID=7130 RepID=UPI00188E816B|nr:zinc finger C2HC domain-containing protein 1C isoform X2 [Manduca sexta]
MEKGGGSRLLQMQARFQQKQMQERELKIASLYEAQQARALDRVRHSPSNGVSVTATSPTQPQPHQPGKVRQMFEERRTKAGIDKSYPLQPIQNTDKAMRKPLPNGYAKVTTSTTSTRVLEKKSTKSHSTVATHTIKKQQKIENIVNGSGDLNHNHKPDLNPIKQQLPQSNGEVIPSTDETDKPDKVENNNEMLENETFPEALAPTPTPQTPEPITEVLQPKRSTPIKTTSPVKTKQQSVTSPPRRITNGTTVSDSNKARGAMQRAANPKSSGPSTPPTPKARAATAAPSSGSGAACTICGRHFAPDRVAKHQEICKKSHTKKRKPFDALKHRLAGTEAEPFINKLRKSTTTPSTTKVNAKPLNSSWRQKHEEFIQAIRAAKQVQAHLNAGGKLSDLPPPPPSENPDYVQCPHCNRRFNQGAAERHIPKCANYQFNKPKPAARRR